MANRVDPDQTAIRAACTGSTLFASILYLSAIISSRRLQQITFSDAFFSWHFKGKCTTTLPNFYPVNLHHSICKHVFSIRVENGVDPDQLALSTTVGF